MSDQMQIGEVAERTGLSINTLRHYDQAGLVPPSARSQGGFRLYTAADVERLLLIRRMKPLGFSLEQMADLLQVADQLAAVQEESVEEPAKLRAALAAYRDTALLKRDKLAAEIAYAEDFIDTMTALLDSAQ